MQTKDVGGSEGSRVRLPRTGSRFVFLVLSCRMAFLVTIPMAILMALPLTVSVRGARLQSHLLSFGYPYGCSLWW